VSSAVLALILSGVAQGAEPIREIRVEGIVHGSPDEVMAKARVSVGDDVEKDDTIEQIREDIRNIHRLSFVSDVTVAVEPILDGIRLIFLIDENPLIDQVVFNGNKKLSDDDLEREIGFTRRHWIVGREREVLFYDPLQARRLKDRILAKYSTKGFPNTEISTSWEETGDKTGTLTFKVSEGRELKISEIRITGAEAFSPDEIRKKMRTRKTRWIIFRSKYDEIKFEQDLLLVRQHYVENGFLNVEVNKGEFETDAKGKGLVVVVTINEGSQFRIGSLRFVGNGVFSSREIGDAVDSATGEVCNLLLLSEDIRKISDLYRGQGYLHGYVTHLLSKHEEQGIADVEFQIKEGERVYLRNVVIHGVATLEEGGDIEPAGLKTKDFVILRTLQLESGEVLDWDEVRRAERRLVNLRYFQQEDDPLTGRPRLRYGFSTEKTEDGGVEDLLLTLEEMQTGSIMFGLGYSSAYGAVASTEYSEKNLLGRGQVLRSSLAVGERRSSGRVSWAEPRFLGSPYSLGVEAYYVTTARYGGRRFEEERLGGSIRVGRPISAHTRASLRYKIESVDISDTDYGNRVILYRPDLYEDRSLTTSSVTLSMYRDTRDYVAFPTGGTESRFSTELAGLGGDSEFFKVIGEHSRYHEVTRKLVLALNGQAGAAFTFDGEDLPLHERFFLGGANSIRGFDDGEVGPHERIIWGFLDERGLLIIDPETGEVKTDKDDVNLGGEAFWEAHAELRYRLMKRVDVVTFLDAGTAGMEVDDLLDDIRVATGVGLRVTIPWGEATIRFDFAVPVVKEDEDNTQYFHFSFGQQF